MDKEKFESNSESNLDLYLSKIEFLIEEKRYSELREILFAMHGADVAEIIGELKREYRPLCFRLLPKDLAAFSFVEMNAEWQEEMILGFTDKELSEILSELYIDDAVDLIEEMPANVVKRIIKNTDKDQREEINRLLRYPKGSAGTIMTTEYVRLKKDMTVSDALAHIRRVGHTSETVYTCYVTDNDRHLIGTISAKDLLLSEPTHIIGDIMEESLVFVKTDEDRELASHKFKKYGFLSLPVVDGELRLVGIITVDDAIEVLADETEADFAKMAAITPSEMPYLKAKTISIFLSRIPWLLLLMISATLSSTILNRFEAFLPTVLILFVPMLMDTGGNSGSQSSVTVIRAISVGEIRFSNILAVMWKELRVGLITGGVLAAAAFIKVLLVDRMLMNNELVTFRVCYAVSLSLFITVICAKLIGAILPITAKKIGFDPAVMASPLITTLVDAISLLVYFAISYALI